MRASLLALLLLSGCAGTPQLDALREAPPAGPARAELHDVPFFPQKEAQCGPAALATLLVWGGADVSPAQLGPQVYLPKRRGSLQLELLAAARRYGRVPYVLRPRLADVLAEISAGHPVLVLQNLSLSWYPRWHFAVVVGFDRQTEHVVLRSGTHRRRRTPLDIFERTWARSEYWAAVVLPPQEAPATARELPYVEAVAGLEQLEDWAAARQGYRTALRRWPRSLTARVGLGNAAYALGDLDAAEQAYRAAVRQYPQAASAHNNLATVLLKQKRLAEAERAARRAVALGGSLTPTYEQTLAEILSQQSAR
ncbi:MAG: PA2778 family cysteine peptidase [Gammaproteobacteria bacterium]|nr:PA2778 family cysteine peptidase [Gammaproteobacteria bacterium]NIT64771.1 PA2778 family cysteine peptidase [Gammaproteobacteria bacterium]NIV21742.1 PA2778 family cysteine peptidase [Gammaproteobacteria bacterium]NIY33351.1 PA2778 family cysteine peptidase [Gammaproteobacteria bacterium]